MENNVATVVILVFNIRVSNGSNNDDHTQPKRGICTACCIYTIVYVTTAFAHSIIRDILHINRFSAQSV